MLLILNVPSWTLKDALKSHDYATAAFEDYFRSGFHRFSSTLTHARYAHSLAHQIPLRDIAKSEVGNGVALFANTAPTTFWLLFYIYSNPSILRDCRQELESVVDISTSPLSNPGEGVRKTFTLEMCKVKTTCPLLVSTLQETLRTISTSVSARLVMQDHLLDGKYLLKKGSVVMMPSPVQHLDPAIWGSDIHTFKHHRFTKSSRAQAAGFRGFGGGTTLCPGRHFASTEILAFVASMILQFDVRPTQWEGWKAPSVQKVAMWEATSAPDTDFEVEISKRERGGDGDWVFVLSESDKPIGMSVEDLTSSKVED
jgi:cytochrome P450